MSRGARRLVLLPAFVFLLANAGAFAAEEKPNFVLILADDMERQPVAPFLDLRESL